MESTQNSGEKQCGYDFQIQQIHKVRLHPDTKMRGSLMKSLKSEKQKKERSVGMSK